MRQQPGSLKRMAGTARAPAQGGELTSRDRDGFNLPARPHRGSAPLAGLCSPCTADFATLCTNAVPKGHPPGGERR